MLAAVYVWNTEVMVEDLIAERFKKSLVVVVGQDSNAQFFFRHKTDITDHATGPAGMPEDLPTIVIRVQQTESIPHDMVGQVA